MEGSHSDFSLFLFLDRPIVFELSLLIVAVAAVVHAVTLHRRVASLIRKQEDASFEPLGTTDKVKIPSTGLDPVASSTTGTFTVHSINGDMLPAVQQASATQELPACVLLPGDTVTLDPGTTRLDGVFSMDVTQEAGELLHSVATTATGFAGQPQVLPVNVSMQSAVQTESATLMERVRSAQETMFTMKLQHQRASMQESHAAAQLGMLAAFAHDGGATPALTTTYMEALSTSLNAARAELLSLTPMMKRAEESVQEALRAQTNHSTDTVLSWLQDSQHAEASDVLQLTDVKDRRQRQSTSAQVTTTQLTLPPAGSMQFSHKFPPDDGVVADAAVGSRTSSFTPPQPRLSTCKDSATAALSPPQFPSPQVEMETFMHKLKGAWQHQPARSSQVPQMYGLERQFLQFNRVESHLLTPGATVCVDVRDGRLFFRFKQSRRGARGRHGRKRTQYNMENVDNADSECVVDPNANNEMYNVTSPEEVSSESGVEATRSPLRKQTTTSYLTGENGSSRLTLRTVQWETRSSMEESIERHWQFLNDDTFSEEVVFVLGPHGTEFRWQNVFMRA